MKISDNLAKGMLNLRACSKAFRSMELSLDVEKLEWCIALRGNTRS